MVFVTLLKCCITITRFHTLDYQTSNQVPKQPQLLLVFLNTIYHTDVYDILTRNKSKAPPSHSPSILSSIDN